MFKNYKTLSIHANRYLITMKTFNRNQTRTRVTSTQPYLMLKLMNYSIMSFVFSMIYFCSTDQISFINYHLFPHVNGYNWHQNNHKNAHPVIKQKIYFNFSSLFHLFFIHLSRIRFSAFALFSIHTITQVLTNWFSSPIMHIFYQ